MDHLSGSFFYWHPRKRRRKKNEAIFASFIQPVWGLLV